MNDQDPKVELQPASVESPQPEKQLDELEVSELAKKLTEVISTFDFGVIERDKIPGYRIDSLLQTLQRLTDDSGVVTRRIVENTSLTRGIDADAPSGYATGASANLWVDYGIRTGAEQSPSLSIRFEGKDEMMLLPGITPPDENSIFKSKWKEGDVPAKQQLFCGVVRLLQRVSTTKAYGMTENQYGKIDEIAQVGEAYARKQWGDKAFEPETPITKEDPLQAFLKKKLGK